MIYLPKAGFGSGRPQAATGNVSAVREFCSTNERPFDPTGEEAAPVRMQTITSRIDDPEIEEDPAITAECEAILGPWTEAE